MTWAAAVTIYVCIIYICTEDGAQAEHTYIARCISRDSHPFGASCGRTHCLYASLCGAQRCHRSFRATTCMHIAQDVHVHTHERHERTPPGTDQYLTCMNRPRMHRCKRSMRAASETPRSALHCGHAREYISTSIYVVDISRHHMRQECAYDSAPVSVKASAYCAGRATDHEGQRRCDSSVAAGRAAPRYACFGCIVTAAAA